MFAARALIFFEVDRFLLFGSAFVVWLCVVVFCVSSCAFQNNDVNTDNSGHCHRSNFQENWNSSLTKEPRPFGMNVKMVF